MTPLSRFAPVLGLFAVYGLFALIGPDSFSSGRTLETIARQTAIVGTAALGMTLVIIAGGIDLSVGSIIALATVTIAASLQAGASPMSASLIGIFTGALCGFVNGLIITRFRVVPFIVTLGTLLIVRGMAKAWPANKKSTRPSPISSTCSRPCRAARGGCSRPACGCSSSSPCSPAASSPIPARANTHRRHWLKRKRGAVVWRSRGSPQSARLYPCGNIRGPCRSPSFSRLTVGDPTVAVGLELDVIAAVVIGGGSLSGGEGSVLGGVVGALIMTVIRAGCSQMGLPNWVQEIVTGAIIVIAVAVDRLRQK